MEPDVVFDLTITRSWPAFALAVVIVLGTAAVASLILHRGLRALARHRGWDYSRIGRIVRPFLALVTVIGAWVAVQLTLPLRAWLDGVGHVALILAIACAAWLLSGKPVDW